MTNPQALTQKPSSILAIIPARGGSKRLKNKNMRPFHGKPLVSHAIETAKNSKLFDAVIVTSDASPILDIARSHNVIAHRRPAKLSTDVSPTWMAVIDALDQYPTYPQTIALLQPTSPLRTTQDISAAVTQFYADTSCRSLMSVCKKTHQPHTPYIMYNNNLHIQKPAPKLDTPYQVVVPNGAIYIVDTKQFKKHKSFFCPPCRAFLMTTESSIDIDTANDLNNATRQFPFA